MADQWKAEVRTIAGAPVIVLDVTITRTLLIDPQMFQSFDGLLKACNLTDAHNFIEKMEDVPDDTRAFYKVPWTEADAKKINLEPFSKIMQRFDDRNFWRLEGDTPTGFVGILTLSGRDIRYDLAERNLASFKAAVDTTQNKINADKTAGKLTVNQAAAAVAICMEMYNSIDKCHDQYEKLKEALAEKQKKDRDDELKRLEDAQKQAAGEASDCRGGLGSEYGGGCFVACGDA